MRNSRVALALGLGFLIGFLVGHSTILVNDAPKSLIEGERTSCPPPLPRLPRPEHLDFRSTLTIQDDVAFTRENVDTDTSPVRICLVTSAISGPTLNGGIATAFYSMARQLASRVDGGREFKVTVLYAAHPYYGRESADYWVQEFAKLDIEFVPLERGGRKHYGPKYIVRSYLIFEYLREREGSFDVVSYHDHMGNGYFTAQAKHLKLAFSKTLLFVQCHSTVRWADELNHRPPKDHNTLGYYYMEQKAIELADARVAPSEYYLRWMVSEGLYNLNHGLSFVVQNLLYPIPSQPHASTMRKSKHFVFLARLEVRKGLLVLLDALDMLAKGPNIPEKLSFLGPDVSVDGKPASRIIRDRAAASKWPFKVCIAGQSFGYILANARCSGFAATQARYRWGSRLHQEPGRSGCSPDPWR